MATAPGHLLGQIIGNVIEEALQPVLQELADRHDLYLDSKGPRPGVRSGRQQRVMRTIDHIVVTPLHGHGSSYPSAPDAVAAVRSYSCGVEAAPFLRFEIRITYTNGDVIQATFGSSGDAVDFLRTFL